MRRFALLILLLVGASAPAQTPSATAAAIAARYGIAGWPQIEKIAFTFNVKLPDQTLSRSWQWEPQADRVTFTDTDGTQTTYERGTIATADSALREIDQKFINDSYWLVFPFHLLWDGGLTFTESDGPEPLPIGSGTAARRLTAQYASDVGYTPGDAYDFYIDDDHMILAWTFRKGGAKEPTRTTTWSPPETFGPIGISLDHHGDGGFRLWFTDVAVDTK